MLIICQNGLNSAQMPLEKRPSDRASSFIGVLFSARLSVGKARFVVIFDGFLRLKHRCRNPMLLHTKLNWFERMIAPSKENLHAPMKT